MEKRGHPPAKLDELFLLEDAESCHLVGNRLLNRPPGVRIGRPGKRESGIEQNASGQRVTDVLRGIGRPWRHISMTVEQQRTLLAEDAGKKGEDTSGAR